MAQVRTVTAPPPRRLTPGPKPAPEAPAKKTAPAPAPAAKASAPANGEEKKKREGKNIGRTTGMRIMQYQDHTMSLQPKRKLTDEELGADWSAEFPEARCVFKDRMDIVRIVRKLFNEHKHGQQTIKLDEPVSKYAIDPKSGKRVAVAEEARAKKATAASEEAEEAEESEEEEEEEG